MQEIERLSKIKKELAFVNIIYKLSFVYKVKEIIK